MRVVSVRERLLREQSGFTLPELLVTVMMMITVLFALYSIFDMTLRVFGFGNDKVEAVENARVALERMEREIRMAYPQDGPNGYDRMFCTTDNSKPGGCKLSTDTTRISFGNDLNGDRNVANCSDSACASVTDYDRNEEITYNFDASNRTLYRASNLDTALTFPSPAPKVAQLGSGCMSFTYFGDDTTADADRDPDVLAGGPPPSNCVFSSLNPLTTSNESKVKIVRLTIIVQVKRGASTGATQMLTTDVALRNRAR